MWSGGLNSVGHWQADWGSICNDANAVVVYCKEKRSGNLPVNVTTVNSGQELCLVPERTNPWIQVASMSLQKVIGLNFRQWIAWSSGSSQKSLISHRHCLARMPLSAHNHFNFAQWQVSNYAISAPWYLSSTKMYFWARCCELNCKHKILFPCFSFSILYIV